MRCADCRLEKPAEELPRHKSYRSGRAPRCKPCHNRRNRENIRRRWGSTRHYHLKQKYGLSAAEVEMLKASQGGICAVCSVRPAVHVDHDHETRRVRGILCELCNGFLGAFGDDPELLRAAIDYLERHR